MPEDGTYHCESCEWAGPEDHLDSRGEGDKCPACGSEWLVQTGGHDD